MPHSSGGGSHGGGGHGGGGFGSHSGGNNVPRTSRHYFPGARVFVYYRHSRPYYVYSQTDLKNTKPNKAAGIFSIIMCLIFIAILTGVGIALIKPPKALSNTSSYQILIEDNKGVLGDTTVLENNLNEFKDKTGITPAIITVDNSAWKHDYNSLESYAYDLYVNRFDDETHWLIVFSTSTIGSFEDWYWEGMQGDETDGILSESKLEAFNNDLQKKLTASSRYTVSQAINSSFSSFNDIVMKNDVDWFVLTIIFFFDGLIIFALITIIKSTFFQTYKNEELCEIEEGPKENPETTTCAYCGGVYVSNLHNNCPHCGASLRKDK